MVQKVRTNSSSELFDNRNDGSRVYDIESRANVVMGKLDNTDSGNVFREGLHMAQFSWMGGDRLNLTYMGVKEEEQISIISAVNAFLREVKDSVATING